MPGIIQQHEIGRLRHGGDQTSFAIRRTMHHKAGALEDVHDDTADVGVIVHDQGYRGVHDTLCAFEVIAPECPDLY
jgi:hypothetical protein